MGFKLLLILEKIFIFLPRSFRVAFFDFLAFCGYHLSPKYRRVVVQNINFAFDGAKSQEEIDAITRYSFKNLLYNFLHILEIRNITKEELLSRVSIEGLEKLQKIKKEGRAIVYATPHYCSWELGGVALGLLSESVACVYKKMKNGQYETWLLEGRAKFGNTNLEKSNVIKPLIRLIKEGKDSAILIDTNINQKDGVLVEFFGKSLRQTSTPAYLARKFNAAIIPIAIRTDDEKHYTIKVFDEIVVERSEDEAQDILNATQAQASWLEGLIKEEPKFWFWLHKRWKNDHPEIYKS